MIVSYPVWILASSGPAFASDQARTPGWVDQVMGFGAPSLTCEPDIVGAEEFMRLWRLEQIARGHMARQGAEEEVKGALASDMYVANRYSVDVIALACARRAVHEGLSEGTLDKATRVATAKCASQAGLLPDEQQRELHWTMRHLLDAAHLDEARNITADSFLFRWPLDPRVLDVWRNRFDGALAAGDPDGAARAARGMVDCCTPGTTWWKVNADLAGPETVRSFVLNDGPVPNRQPAADVLTEIATDALDLGRERGHERLLLEADALASVLVRNLSQRPEADTWRGIMGQARAAMGRYPEAIGIFDASAEVPADVPGVRPNRGAEVLVRRARLASREGGIAQLWNPEVLPRRWPCGVKKELDEETAAYVAAVDSLRVGELEGLEDISDGVDEARLQLEAARILLAHRRKSEGAERLAAVVRAWPDTLAGADAAETLANLRRAAGDSDTATHLEQVARHWRAHAPDTGGQSTGFPAIASPPTVLGIVQSGIELSGAGSTPGVLVSWGGSEAEISADMLSAWLRWSEARGQPGDAALARWLGQPRKKAEPLPTNFASTLTCQVSPLLLSGQLALRPPPGEAATDVVLFQDHAMDFGEGWSDLVRRISLPAGEVALRAQRGEDLLFGDPREARRRVNAMGRPVMWPELHTYELRTLALSQDVEQASRTWVDAQRVRLGLPSELLVERWRSHAEQTREADPVAPYEARITAGEDAGLFESGRGWVDDHLAWAVGSLLIDGSATLLDEAGKPVADVVVVDWQRGSGRAQEGPASVERWFLLPGQEPFLVLKSEVR